METADSTSTLQNSLQPSQPRRKYQEYPVHMLRRAVKFCPGIPSRSGNFGWKFIRSTPTFLSFFFFFSSVCPALPHVFTFPLGFAGSIRCHYTPHKAARHRPGRSSATARNSEIIGIVVEAGVILFAVSEQHAKFFTFLFLFDGSVINVSKLINRGIDFKEKGGAIDIIVEENFI